MKLIAEIKKFSPYTQVEFDIDPEQLAKSYTELGASAISIVTAKSFKGDKEWIKAVRAVTTLPIFCKDFLLKIEDVEKVKEAGADWLLFVSEMYTLDELDFLTFHANRIGIKPVVEAHSRAGLYKALSVDTNRVMINNRDLKTGKINMMNAFNFAPLLSDQRVLYTASGYDMSLSTIPQLKQLDKYEYILIGSCFLQSINLPETFKNIITKLNEN